MINVLKSLPFVLEVVQQEPPVTYINTTNLYEICYNVDGYRVMGYIALPKNIRGEIPIVIFNRGGNRDFAPLHPNNVCQHAVRGYAAFGSQYRGNQGGTGTEEFGGADVNDVIRLIDMALALPFSIKTGVYMHGHSRGGMMTYLACARDFRIKAAAVGAGVADAFIMYETREQSMKDVYHELIGGGPNTHRDAFIARSGTYWAEQIMSPILICQGTNDWRVVPEQSYMMYEKLQEAGKESKLIVYDGADHSLKGTTYLDDVDVWFKEHPLI